MSIYPTRGAALLASLLALPLTAAAAAPATPQPTTLLFDTPHLARTESGQKLRYRLQRAVTQPAVQGEGFTDEITVDIASVADAGTRDVVVKVFTGERARPPQSITGMTGNPLLVVFLDRVVNNFAMLAGGSRPFLKHKVKTSFVIAPQITPVEVVYKGRKVAGHWIRVMPFRGDAEALKMMGYDGMSLDIVVSDEVPGQFVNMAAHYASPTQDAPRLEEAITMEGIEEIRFGGAR